MLLVGSSFATALLAGGPAEGGASRSGIRSCSVRRVAFAVYRSARSVSMESHVWNIAVSPIGIIARRVGKELVSFGKQGVGR